MVGVKCARPTLSIAGACSAAGCARSTVSLLQICIPLCFTNIGGRGIFSAGLVDQLHFALLQLHSLGLVCYISAATLSHCPARLALERSHHCLQRHLSGCKAGHRHIMLLSDVRALTVIGHAHWRTCRHDAQVAPESGPAEAGGFERRGCACFAPACRCERASARLCWIAATDSLACSWRSIITNAVRRLRPAADRCTQFA
jgi:hypothetical protein